MTKNLKTEMRDISTLTSDPDNARARGPRALEAIVNSLSKFGQQKPIVISPSGVVIAGNGTLDAAKQLGWTKIAVHVTALTGAEQRAFAIADNRTAELAFWNDDMLIATLEELAADPDPEVIGTTGFTMADLEGMRAAASAAEDDPSIKINTDGQAERNDGDGDDFDSEADQFRLIAAFTSAKEADAAKALLLGIGVESTIVEL